MSYKNAKIAYMLCVCHDFASKIFTKMIKKHEKTFTACTKYYFDLEIEMNFETPDNGQPQNQSNFKIKNVCCNFLNRSSSDKHVHKILEEINFFSPKERKTICDNYTALISTTSGQPPKLEKNYDRHLYPLANLINMYADKYRYLFVPCTLDYSQDVGLVHQCAIIVDLQDGEFIFYEPYGTYIKYNHNYAHPMRQYFEIYANCLPARFKTNYQGAAVKSRTFHERHSIYDGGIQQIILNFNNAAAADFEKSRAALFSDEFQREFADLYRQIKNQISLDTNPVNQTDNTIDVLTIMEQFEKYTPAEEKKEEYEKFWQKALGLYHDYNSKTCVSISLVELNLFFSGADLSKFYERYQTIGIKPNTVLMEELGALLTEIDPPSAQINEFTKVKHLCSNLV